MVAVIVFGFIFGFFGAIPVAGPVSAMIVERSIQARFGGAFLLALGTSVADGLYAAFAVYGFSFLVDYPWVMPASKAVAGVLLIAVGLMFALKTTAPGEQAHDPNRDPDSLIGHFALGLGLTLANLTLLATWTVATSMLYASGWVTLGPSTGIPFGLAVAAGAACWFCMIVVIIRKIRGRFKPESLARFIKWMGWGLVGLGAWFTVLFVKYLVTH